MSIINSIDYSIRLYAEKHRKLPDKITVNYNCFNKILPSTILQIHETKGMTVCGVPMILSDVDEELPRFWICEEGVVYE